MPKKGRQISDPGQEVVQKGEMTKTIARFMIQDKGVAQKERRND